MTFFRRWQNFFPKAKAISYPDASHYLLEDKYIEVSKEISTFLN
jgi:hypothetical protein